MVAPKQRWILSVLGILVVAVWVRGLAGRPARSGTPASPGRAEEPVTRATAEAKPQPIQSRSAEWGGNPFEVDHRPLAAAPTKQSEGYVVTGILWDPERPSAIINNRLVAIGDRLDQWQVAQITRNQVVLSDGATTQTLNLE